MNVSRVALPGIDASTDTNPDHFSLFSDVDNVLIKRQQISTATITDGSPTILTIPHNLGYIPFFIVYCDPNNDGNWQILNNQYNTFSVPQQIAAADTSNLYIYNFGGHASGSLHVVYEIFYDNMNDTTAPSITESNNVFKVARPGIDASQSKNPNDYIMHSDLNNYKIIKEGTASKDLNGFSSWIIPHGATITTPYKYLVFIKDGGDGKTILIGGSADTKTYDESTSFFGSSIDGTNITITFPTQGGSTPVTAKFYIFGSGVAATIPPSVNILAVAKEGIDVMQATNPDDFNFHSNFNTLKYFSSDTYSMTVTNTTVHSIAHNLGYVPLFIVFVGDLQGIISNGYALLPYYLGNSNVSNLNRDIAAWAYADATNIYLKAFYQSNAVGTSKTFNFYYKIFKNNLGL